MRKFVKEGKKSQPKVSTAALPDIVFMLLFFFMVAASIKTSSYDKYITLVMPKATELKQADKKELVSYIFIGKPNDRYSGELGSAPIILINDKPATIDQLPQWTVEEREKRNPQDWSDMITQIQVDKNAKVGLVQDVKDVLAQNQRFKVLYAASQGDINDNARP
ncbi:MAG: biopolymer transporter ExbD [Flavobacteriales bacterium]|nr:biopolymer transporter ExbD [Flavobacteriales bacterium]